MDTMGAVSARQGAAEDSVREINEGRADAFGFDRKVEQARALLVQNPLCRPALYRILATCAPERILLHDLEDRILAMEEYEGVTQPPFFLMQWLVDVHALDMFELDDEGYDVTEERKEGLSEDEIDDLVVDFSYRTNEVGFALLGEFQPAERLQELLTVVPERYDTYIEVLEFVAEPRSYAEIDELLRGRDILMFGREPDDRPMQPSVFVDKLAATGSIVYNEGWHISEEGKEFLRRSKE